MQKAILEDPYVVNIQSRNGQESKEILEELKQYECIKDIKQIFLSLQDMIDTKSKIFDIIICSNTAVNHHLQLLALYAGIPIIYISLAGVYAVKNEMFLAFCEKYIIPVRNDFYKMQLRYPPRKKNKRT